MYLYRHNIISGIYVFVTLSVYLSICLDLFICLSVYLSRSGYLSICLSVYLSICLSVYLSICLSVYLSICLSVYLSICLSVHLSMHQHIYLITYLCEYVSADMSIIICRYNYMRVRAHASICVPVIIILCINLLYVAVYRCTIIAVCFKIKQFCKTNNTVSIASGMLFTVQRTWYVVTIDILNI